MMEGGALPLTCMLLLLLLLLSFRSPPAARDTNRRYVGVSLCFVNLSTCSHAYGRWAGLMCGTNAHACLYLWPRCRSLLWR